MKKNLIIFTMLTLYISALNAQSNGLISDIRYNTGGYVSFSAGPSYCIGDTYDNYSKSIMNGNNWSTSLNYKDILSEHFGYGLNLSYSNYAGTETTKKHYPYYSFTSNIMEVSFRAIYNVRFGQKYRLQTPNSIYAFIGMGAVSTDVKSVRGAAPVVPHTYTGIFPFGMGYQRDFNNGLCIGFEGQIKYGLDDTLDGYIVANSSNDILVNFAITIGYKLF